MSDRCEKCGQKVRPNNDPYAFGVWKLNERTQHWRIRLAPGIGLNLAKGDHASEGRFWIYFANGWKTFVETDDLEVAKTFALEVAINLANEAWHRASKLRDASK